MPALQILLTPHLFSPNASSPAFPFNYGPCHVQSLPLQSATRLTCLYSPCINLLLAVLTHLACWASRNPDVTHPSMPATTNPARPKRSPSICIRHSVPANPCLCLLVQSFSRKAPPRLPVRAFPSLTSRHLPLRACLFCLTSFCSLCKS